MVKILSATFGDQVAQRDVTQSVVDKVESGELKATANEELIPAFEVSKETRLTNSDLAEIDRKAQEQCKGGADSACIRSTKAKLMQEKLDEKAQKDTSTANILVGRRLTLTYEDDKGKVRRTVVPDGQKIELDNVENFTNKTPTKSKSGILASAQKLLSEAMGTFWWTFLFVFSVAAAYRVFKIYGNAMLAVFIGTLAVLLPLAGYSPQFGVYLFLELGKMSKEKALAALPSAPQVDISKYMPPAPSAPPFEYPGGLLPSAPPLENSLAALKGAAGSVDSVLGSLKGANPAALLGSFLGKR